MLVSPEPGPLASPRFGRSRLGMPKKKATAEPKASESKNPLAFAAAKTCKSCEQNSHDLDRDANPDLSIFVAWAKTRDHKGHKAPCGEECYRCFDVRRRFFGLQSLDDLLEKRRACPALDEKFFELRRDRISGEGKYQHQETIDVERFIEKTSSHYDDRFEEGTFHELWSFAESRRLPFKRGQEGELIQHIEEKLDKRVIEDEDGVVGVEIMDSPPGQYRFKRGKKTAIGATRKEKFNNKEALTDCWETMQSKAALAQGPKLEMKGFRPFSSKGASDSAGPPDETQTDFGDLCPATLPPLRSRDAALAQAQACRPELQARAHPQVKSLAALRGLAAKLGSQGTGTASTRSGSPRYDDDEDTQTSTGASSRKKRRSAHCAVLESTQAFLQKVESEMTWQLQWESKSRKRDFEGLLTKLATHGRRCGAILGNEQAANLSQQCYDMSDILERRAACFEKLRLSFGEFVVNDLSPEDMKVLEDAPRSLLGSILTMSAQGLLDKCASDPKALTAFISVLACDSKGDPAKVTLAMVKTDSPETESMVEQAQKGLALALAERVWKALDPSLIVTTMSRLESLLPFDEIDLDEICVAGAPLVHGWVAQAIVDLKCIVVCGKVLDHIASSGEMPRPLRAECLALARNSAKLTPRLKSLFKKISGAQVQHGKTAWDLIGQAHEEWKEQTQQCNPEKVKIYEGLSKNLNDASQAKDYSEVYNIMCDIANDHAEDLKSFGRVFQADSETADSAKGMQALPKPIQQ